MEKAILNKVEQSGLVQINLEDLYLTGERAVVDLKPWLLEELILKEKIFRDFVKEHDWSKYKGRYVAVMCSADAIIPTWAFMIVAIHLTAYATDIVFGDLNKLEEYLFFKQLAKIDPEQYRDQRVVIKGCGEVPVPATAYVELTRMLQPVVKSIMYGEPCSTVPVFKRKEQA